MTDSKLFKCSNCSGNHSAVSRECPKHKEHPEKTQKPTKTNNVPEGFYRNFSSDINNGSSLRSNYPRPNNINQSTTNSKQVFPYQGSSCGVNHEITGTFLLFLTEVLLDITNITTNIEEQNGATYLNLVEKYFGNVHHSSISNLLHNDLDSSMNLSSEEHYD